MNKNFTYYLSKFLKEYLVVERNLSPNTIKSYKDTFKLLVIYLISIKKIKIENIDFNVITRDNILDFLKYLEEVKKNTIQTRNQRLKAIRTFCNFCLNEEIENIDNISRILKINFKKVAEPVIDFLTEEELIKVFDNIDTSTLKGRRNLTIISLLYDTAARSDEVLKLKVEDINFYEKYLILDGKGRKERIVPICDNTIELLRRYMEENNVTTSILFKNKHQEKFNNRFLRDLIYKYVNIPSKNITPHVFRHTRAIHLLSAGVPLIYIRDLLGHSINKNN